MKEFIIHVNEIYKSGDSDLFHGNKIKQMNVPVHEARWAYRSFKEYLDSEFLYIICYLDYTGLCGAIKEVALTIAKRTYQPTNFDFFALM